MSGRITSVFAVAFWLVIGLRFPLFAQTFGTVRGTVLDPSDAVVPNATVEIQNPVAHYTQTTKTNGEGKFEFNNVPFNNYHLSASAPGFQTGSQDVDVRSAIPLEIKVELMLGGAATELQIQEAQDLVEADPTTHTDIDRGLFEKLPLESSSSSLSSLVTLASPGVAADSNGLFHGLGDHAENSFSVDGQPITDQQSKVFSNQIPVSAVQSMEVIQGAPPAEYGDKTSLVIVVTTRSGLGAMQTHGNATSSYGSFGTSNVAFDLTAGSPNWGNFISLNAMNTGRFLDAPEFEVMHAHGNQQNIFDRVDFKPSTPDTVNVNFNFTRSWFQTPNSFDAQNATAWSGLVVDNGGLGPNGIPVGPQDQRSQIKTFNIAPTWTRLLSNSNLLTVSPFVRQDRYNYYPSADPFADLTPNLQRLTVGQARRLTNAGIHADVSHTRGIHNIKFGAQLRNTWLTENDTFGIVDPTLNAPCLNPDGSPFTGTTPNNPGGCTGILIPNPAFVPILACLDLTRTGSLAANGCPNSTAAPYLFSGTASIRQTDAYIQDTITRNAWTFNLGFRTDLYRGISVRTEWQPRLGVSYNVKKWNTVLRLSYARTMETPFNENLVLSSLGCNNATVNALMSTIGPCITSPIVPGFRNEFHAGLEQAFGRYLVVDGEYIWKYTHGAYDFSVFANTPITFPIEWNNSKIPGFAIRTSVPNYHGFTAFVVMSGVAARFFTPQVGGIGATPQGVTVFRIDHDEKFNQSTHLQYQFGKDGAWFSMNWRYDSGLVAGPVPCAGGNCANGPEGTDTIVDVAPLSPDQQFQAGLACAGVRATPTTPISPSGLCPALQYTSSLVNIPAPGTQNDDHNPARIVARNLFDLGAGHDNLFKGDRYKWSARVEVVNLTNKVALYNFLSTFSGTHYVTPRTVSATLGFHF